MISLVHGATGYDQKCFKLVWRCHQLLSGFLANGHLPRVSRQLRLSLMIRVIIRWSHGLCTDRSLDIYLTAKENLTMKAVRPVIPLNGFPFLQMRSLGWHSTPGREWVGFYEVVIPLYYHKAFLVLAHGLWNILYILYVKMLSSRGLVYSLDLNYFFIYEMRISFCSLQWCFNTWIIKNWSNYLLNSSIITLAIHLE